MPRVKDHVDPVPKLKYAQLTAWPLLNPTTTFFSRHENHDHAIAVSSKPLLTIPMPPPNNYSVYAYDVTPLYNESASKGGHSIHDGPPCWQKAQENFKKTYSNRYINRSLNGNMAFNVQHPLGAAIVDPCCNTLQKNYYWHIAALPTIVPLPKE